MKLVNDFTGQEAKDLLVEICKAFSIGEKAATRTTILTNIANCRKFADLLHSIEHEFFMVPMEDDDEEDPLLECLVNSWGSSKEEYIEQFRQALKTISPSTSDC